MSTYLIGDVQGCFEPLQRLLDVLSFQPSLDSVLFLGDLVNRGPHSLEVLRFVSRHESSMTTVLGNHDLHFLAVALGQRGASKGDTLQDLLRAPDLPELIAWLRAQPILAERGQALAVHAGVLPTWSIAECRKYARELEFMLRGPDLPRFLREMYGNEPDRFDETLTGMVRLRALTNVFTRMRFCSSNGRLDLISKHGAASAKAGMKPWFAHPGRLGAEYSIVFGHWAALQGVTETERAQALDTGCVWGRELTALCLETGKRTSVSGIQSS